MQATDMPHDSQRTGGRGWSLLELRELVAAELGPNWRAPHPPGDPVGQIRAYALDACAVDFAIERRAIREGSL